MLNDLGVSTVTIDLPSYHNSAKVTIPKNKIEYLSFIREQFEILNFKKIFIISPSMSGKVCKPKLHFKWLKNNALSIQMYLCIQMSHLIPILTVLFSTIKNETGLRPIKFKPYTAVNYATV